MNRLAQSLLQSGYWESGNAYAYTKVFNIQDYVGSTCARLLHALGLTRVAVVETPSNGASFDSSVPAATVLQGICDREFLLFRRVLPVSITTSPPSKTNKGKSSHQTASDIRGLIFTANKHVILTQADKKNFETYLKRLTGHHRQAIRRFRRKMTEATDGFVYSFATVPPERALEYYDILLPLHNQVQERNGGDKGGVFLRNLLESCADDPAHFRCLILSRQRRPIKQSNTKKDEADVEDATVTEIVEEEAVAFAIIVRDVVPYTVLNESEPQEVWCVPLVGNDAVRGHHVLAYHNLLCRMVADAVEAGVVLDLGYGHYDVKKVFEPCIIPQYLEYIGNSFAMKWILQTYTNWTTGA